MPWPDDESDDVADHSVAGRAGNRTWQTATATALQLTTTVLVVPLLRWAARRDKHFHTNLGRASDELIRSGAGTFFLAGVVAALPAGVAMFIARPRWPSVALVAACIALGAGCDVVVSLAPEPWFTF